MIFALVTSYDFEEGLDLFLPQSSSTTDLGAAIRRSLDASRVMEFSTLPVSSGSEERDREEARWRAVANRFGAPHGRGSYLATAGARVFRLKGSTVFYNNARRGPGEFRQIPNHRAEYREFVLQQPEDDLALGEAAHQVLDACVG